MVRRSDGGSRTRDNAARAMAAVIARWSIGRELKCGEDFAEECPGAKLRMNLHGALAVPAEPGGTRPVALQHGAGVHVEFLDTAQFGDGIGEITEFGVHHVVVVVAPGIPRNAAASAFILARRRRGAIVIQSHRHHGAHAGQDLARVHAARRILRHVGHVAVFTRSNPFLIGLCVRCRSGYGGNAAIVEAERRCDGLHSVGIG